MSKIQKGAQVESGAMVLEHSLVMTGKTIEGQFGLERGTGNMRPCSRRIECQARKYYWYYQRQQC